MSIVARLEQSALDPAKELAGLLEQAEGDGAVVSFVGVARARSSSGQAVERLILEHHPLLSAQSLEDIARSAAERFLVSQVRVVHRFGEVVAGEPIVFAGATSPHRRAAFEAADYLMDHLKTKAVFWKREIGDGRSEWIEPTKSDHADLKRWG